MEVFAVLASVQSMGLTGIQGYPVTVEAYCAVSYTHLDVYKRQVSDKMKNND